MIQLVNTETGKVVELTEVETDVIFDALDEFRMSDYEEETASDIQNKLFEIYRKV